jgi:Uma2 family endonuclease
MAPQTSIKLTYEDYAAIPEDGLRHEIIDGEHYVNPAPNIRHQIISMRLSMAIGNVVYGDGLGHLFAAPTDVALTKHDIAQPDLFFIRNTNAHILAEKKIVGVPDLVIEILSSNRDFDERVKYRSYERAGVPEYWIVDPFDDAVNVFRRAGDRFQRVDLGDTLTTPLLPGFALSLQKLFA